MTPFEIELAGALGRVSGWVGARFLDSISHIAKNTPGAELSLRQRHYMEIMAWRYRRQLADHLVPHQKPLPMPRGIPPPKEPRKPKATAPDDQQMSLL